MNGNTVKSTKEKMRINEEKRIREIILKEIEKRLRNNSTHLKNINQKPVRGLWSSFNFDFTGAEFFYHVDFSRSVFESSVNFCKTKFLKGVDFSDTLFIKEANFSIAEFNTTKYSLHTAIFKNTTFTGKANFSYANFSGGEYSLKFPTVTFEKSKFNNEADFHQAHFYTRISFNEAVFEKYEPTFAKLPEYANLKSKFSNKIRLEDNDFKVSSISNHKIETKEQELDGVTLRIPKGAVLFDPTHSRTGRPWTNITSLDNTVWDYKD